MHESATDPVSFPDLAPDPVPVDVDFLGGRLTSDGGLAWLAEAEAALGLTSGLAAMMPDWRRRGRHPPGIRADTPAALLAAPVGGRGTAPTAAPLSRDTHCHPMGGNPCRSPRITHWRPEGPPLRIPVARVLARLPEIEVSELHQRRRARICRRHSRPTEWASVHGMVYRDAER